MIIPQKRLEADWDFIQKEAKEIAHPALRATVLRCLKLKETAFWTVRGSDFQHHDYYGGLLVHTASALRSCLALAELYKPDHPDLSMDLLRFGAILHDIGKCNDYDLKDSKDYPTTDFKPRLCEELIGHPIEGVILVGKILHEELRPMGGNYEFSVTRDNGKIYDMCMHMICQHMHGEDNWHLYELTILGFADWLDSYMASEVTENEDGSLTLGNGCHFYKAPEAIRDTSVFHRDKNHSMLVEHDE